MTTVDFLFSRIRVFRVRLRYYFYKAKIKYHSIDFIWDNSKKFHTLVSNLEKQKYEKIIIIGNAPNIIELNDSKYQKYINNDKTLTVGLNKSYLKYDTDLLLWSDHIVMKDLLEDEGKVSNTIFIFVSQLLDDRRTSLHFWKEHQTFKDYPYKTLFKARTILISALHLAYILNIKKIELYGISFDDGSYFYNNPHSRTNLEFLSRKEIDNTYYGYTMQKITKEVLEYLIHENFEVKYNGKSNFLDSITNIKKS